MLKPKHPLRQTYFDLPHPMVLEEEAETTQRVERVKKLFADIAQAHLWREEAHKVFSDLVRHFKPADEETNALILKAYDANPSLSLAQTALRLHKQYPDKFKKAQPGATAKRLARLLAKRKKSKDADRKFAQMYKPTKSFLGDM
jgi:hypothetical protein